MGMSKQKLSDINRLLIATAIVAIVVSIFKTDIGFTWLGLSTTFGHLLLAFFASNLLLFLSTILNLKFVGRYVVCAVVPAIAYFTWIAVAGNLLLLLAQDRYMGSIDYIWLATIPITVTSTFYLLSEIAVAVYNRIMILKIAG